MDFGKKYSQIADFIHQNSKLIKNDLQINSVIQTFFFDILKTLDKDQPNPSYTDLFKKLYLLHKGKIYEFPKDKFEIVIVELTKLYKLKPQIAQNYAQEFPENEICKKVIEDYEKNYQKIVTHSQEDKIQVIENPTGNTDYSKSLFNSLQEKLFFEAVRNVYPTFFIYPNVALSEIFHFEDIKKHLNSKQIDFFLKSTVDAVIFDQMNSYYPISAIELDSLWHYKEKQIEKDKMKDYIFKIGGLKLYRIEHKEIEKTVAEFETVILENIKR